jgi:hypothetical protein
LNFVFVALFWLSSYFLFLFVCRWPHSLGNSPGSKRANGLSGAMSPQRLAGVVSSAVHAAVQACALQPADADDAVDGDMVDGADGNVNGEEALGRWMFQEGDKEMPVKCARARRNLTVRDRMTALMRRTCYGCSTPKRSCALPCFLPDTEPACVQEGRPQYWC